MKRLARLFWVILALLFLFEAWLWTALRRSSVALSPLSRGMDQAGAGQAGRSSVAASDPRGFRRSVHSPAAAQIPRILVPGAPPVGGDDCGSGAGETHRPRCHRIHIRGDQGQTVANGLV